MAYLLGFALGMLIFPFAGYLLANYLNRNREYGDSVRWPIGVGVALSIIGLLGQCSSAQRAEPGANPANDMIVERVTGRPASDLPATIPSDLLKNFADGMARQTAAKANTLGWTKATPPRETHSQTLLRFGDKYVVRVDTELEDFATVVQFAGVMAGKEENVVCITRRPTKFVYEGSKCETEVLATYGPAQSVGAQ